MLQRTFMFSTPTWRNGAVVGSNTLALARVLAGRGHRVILLVSGRADTNCVPEKDLTMHAWPRHKPMRYQDFPEYLSYVRMYKPDCVIGHFGTVNATVIGGRICGVRERVAWYHTPAEMIRVDGKIPRWQLPFLKWRRRLIYQMATRVVAVSKSSMRDACSEFGVPSSKANYLYNCLEEPFAGTPSGDEVGEATKDRIVCVARLDPTKGQDVLIRAVALLFQNGHNVFVDLVGKGPTMTSLMGLVEQLGLTERVRFLGSRSHAEVMRVFRSALISIVPSRVDAGALTLIESMSVGCPVIASNAGAAPEMLDNGIEGFLFDEGSPESLARAMQELLTNDKLRRDMGLRGRQRFLQDYEQSRNILKHADWLESIVNKCR